MPLALACNLAARDEPHAIRVSLAVRGIRPFYPEPWAPDAERYNASYGTVVKSANTLEPEERPDTRLAAASESRNNSPPQSARERKQSPLQLEYDAWGTDPQHFGLDPLRVPSGFASARGQPSARGPGTPGRQPSPGRQPDTPGRTPRASARKKFAERSASSPIVGGSTPRRSSEGWDSSPFRPTPHALRGVKPVTPEPWAHDQQVVKIYREESTEEGEGSGFHINTARCSVSTDSAPTTARTGYDSARLGSARLGSARLGSARGQGAATPRGARPDSARLGSARLGSARLGSARTMSAGSMTPRTPREPKASPRRPPWAGVSDSLQRAFHMPSWERWASSLSK